MLITFDLGLLEPNGVNFWRLLFFKVFFCYDIILAPAPEPRARLGTFRSFGTERTLRGFGTERARLGTFRGFGT